MTTTAPLTLVVAPSGYGKTWALVEFAHSASMPVTWYGIEQDDVDPIVFLSGLYASLAYTFQSIPLPRLAIHDASPSGLIAAATELLEAVETLVPQMFVTVLDDYHIVDDRDDITALVEFILRHVPENWRLVISSRHTPRLRLIKLIASGAVSGIGKADLAFNSNEVLAFLHAAGVEEHPGLAEDILRATDGWPLAVALLVKVVKGDLHSLSLFQTIGHQALEALIWDVLNQLPGWRSQLMEAAVFDELGPEELASVVGQDKVTTFSTVAPELPLVTEVAPGRFIMHDMLRSALLAHLKEREPLHYLEAHRRAGELYRVRSPEAAVRHFVEAGLPSEAATVLETLHEALFFAGRWRTIVELGRRLPATELTRRPSLSLSLAKSLYQLGMAHQALQLISEIVARAQIEGNTTVEAHALAERSVAHRLCGLLHRAKEDAERALALAPIELAVRAGALRNLGIVLGQLGQPETAEEHLRSAHSAYSALNDRYSAALCLTDLANLYLSYRRILEARSTFNQAIALWKELGNEGNLALALNGAGVAANLTGDWTVAENTLLEALERARKSGYARAEAYALASLADLRMDQGHFQASTELFHQAHRVATEVSEAFLIVYALDGLARAARAARKLQEAAQWNARAFQQATELAMAQEKAASQLTAALIQTELGNYGPAEEGLSPVLQAGENLLDLRRLCVARMLQAYLRFRSGQRDEAVKLVLDLAAGGCGSLLSSAELDFASPLLDEVARQGLVPALSLRTARAGPLTEGPTPPLRSKPPKLIVKMLGPIEVTVDDIPVKDWEAASARDLLLYLVHLRRPERKEALMELFWPEQPPGKASSALQSALYRVRRLVGKETIRFHQGWYTLEAEIHTDVDEFRNLLRLADHAADGEERRRLLEQALTLYRGDYLENIYDSWPEPERHELRELRFEALRRLATFYYDSGDYLKAIALCRQATRLDPYREAFHRILMKALARNGDRAGALQQYQQLQDLLRRDLSMQPEPATRMIFDTISRGEL